MALVVPAPRRYIRAPIAYWPLDMIGTRGAISLNKRSEQKMFKTNPVWAGTVAGSGLERLLGTTLLAMDQYGSQDCPPSTMEVVSGIYNTFGTRFRLGGSIEPCMLFLTPNTHPFLSTHHSPSFLTSVPLDVSGLIFQHLLFMNCEISCNSRLCALLRLPN
jgi:hypothetical protein